MSDLEDLDNFEPVARIVVIGVGGAGNNAVNRMVDENIRNVEFYVANTDKLVLSTSRAPNRIILGDEKTKGLGAGGNPEAGEAAANVSKDKIKAAVEGADMVFIAAGMGKGTGTGAAPVIAQIAKDCGALVVAIVTRPFTIEGPRRTENASHGLAKLKEIVDAIIIVSNDRLLMSLGNATVDEAFSASDKILAQSVKTVADLILVPAQINLDFADVKSTLENSGLALIGYGMGEGKNKAAKAVDDAINSPLLETGIRGARRAIVSVTCGRGVSLFEAQETIQKINEKAGNTVDVKMGVGINPNLEDTMIVSVIASDFADDPDFVKAPKVEIPTDASQIGGQKDDELSPSEEKDVTQEDDGFISGIIPDFLNGGQE